MFISPLSLTSDLIKQETFSLPVLKPTLQDIIYFSISYSNLQVKSYNTMVIGKQIIKESSKDEIKFTNPHIQTHTYNYVFNVVHVYYLISNIYLI